MMTQSVSRTHNPAFNGEKLAKFDEIYEMSNCPGPYCIEAFYKAACTWILNNPNNPDEGSFPSPISITRFYSGKSLPYLKKVINYISFTTKFRIDDAQNCEEGIDRLKKNFYERWETVKKQFTPNAEDLETPEEMPQDMHSDQFAPLLYLLIGTIASIAIWKAYQNRHAIREKASQLIHFWKKG